MEIINNRQLTCSEAPTEVCCTWTLLAATGCHHQPDGPREPAGRRRTGFQRSQPECLGYDRYQTAPKLGGEHPKSRAHKCFHLFGAHMHVRLEFRAIEW